MNNLLVDPLVSTACGRLTLPQLLEALAKGEEVDYLRIAAWQMMPWHAFLCQIGALVLERNGIDALCMAESDWRDGLLRLADNQESAWCLLESDLHKPAFMQPPGGSLDEYKKQFQTADEIDVLQKAKGHDVKPRLLTDSDPECWVYSLVTAQTMGRYGGRGVYGIARTAGAPCSRAFFSAAPGPGWAPRFAHDVECLMGISKGDRRKHVLLWTSPWDGKTSIRQESVHPVAVEVCRRMRLVEENGNIKAARAGSSVKRVEGFNMPDAWGARMPETKSAVSFSITGNRHLFRGLAPILFDQDLLSPSILTMLEKDRPFVLEIQSMRTGLGKTKGLVDRRIEVPAGVNWDQVGHLASAWTDLARQVLAKAVRPAVAAWAQSRSPADLRHDPRTEPSFAAFEEALDAQFFSLLMNGSEGDWRDLLWTASKDTLASFWSGKMQKDTSKYKQRSLSSAILYAGLESCGILPPESPEHIDPE